MTTTVAPIRTVGFIGLGVMGAPMAANLVAAGFDVVALNRHQSASERLIAAGGRIGGSIAEVTKGADAVITMLPDGPAVEEVALGPAGVMASAHTGLLFIDMSTVDVATTQRVADAAQEAGVAVLDAPVSGGEAGAVQATLSIMVGGSSDDYERARPVFRAVGQTMAHVGPTGTGQIVKAANQLIVGGTIALVAEAIVFLEAHRVAMGPAVQVLAGGLAGNRVLDRKSEGMLARDFRPGFRVDLHHKDMGILLDAARAAGVTVPVASLVGQLFGALRARGDGELDHTALLRLVEALSGRDHPDEGRAR